VKDKNLPLGQDSDYPQKYAPDVLCPIARADSREPLGLADPLPFTGVDVWNAWELTWLGPGGRPEIAAVEMRVPAQSPNLIESKSMKLYLGSIAMTRFDAPEGVTDAVARDLSACAGTDVDVSLNPDLTPGELAGECLDKLDIECSTFEVNPALLAADTNDIADESLHTHLLRSLCPVTGQPDIGSLEVSYSGPRIDPSSLLQYVVSFREHNDFHEACVERVFVDILERCRPGSLSVYARYQRRGGIDINPFRTNTGAAPLNLRLWRQ